jgi:hypothetical protein
MIRRKVLDMHDISNGGIPKPREFGKRQEKLFIPQQQPEALLRDVGNLNW